MEVSKVFPNWPSFGFGKVWTKLVKNPKKSESPHSTPNIETPIDLYIEIVNFVAAFPGLDGLKIDRNKGYLMSWNEMNDIWAKSFKSVKKYPSWIGKVLRKDK